MIGKIAEDMLDGVMRQVPGLHLFADQPAHPLVNAMQRLSEGKLRQQALSDVGKALLLGGGIGAAGAGLAHVARDPERRDKKAPPGQVLPLPYPVEDSASPQKLLKRGGLFGDITSKAGIPWYIPGVAGAGLLGAAGGYGGINHLLKSREKKRRAEQLEEARREFHDSLISQYDAPLSGPPKLASDRGLSAALDSLFDHTCAAMEKSAVTLGDVAGASLGGYGLYAGLSSLLAGGVVYDQLKKRSRRAILDKAIAKRDRRRFAQSPPEIYAMPEPMPFKKDPGRFTPADAEALGKYPADEGLR